MDEITRISKEIMHHYKMSDEEFNEHILPLIDAVREEMTGLTKEEARMVWNVCNVFQDQLLTKFQTHLQALNKMYGSANEQALQWTQESVQENDLLQTIKTKMIKRLCDE